MVRPGLEPRVSRLPCEHSTTELPNHMIDRLHFPLLFLSRLVPESARNHAGTDETDFQGETITGRSVAQHGKRETLGSSPGRATFFFRPCDIWWVRASHVDRAKKSPMDRDKKSPMDRDKKSPMDRDKKSPMDRDKKSPMDRATNPLWTEPKNPLWTETKKSPMDRATNPLWTEPKIPYGQRQKIPYGQRQKIPCGQRQKIPCGQSRPFPSYR